LLCCYHCYTKICSQCNIIRERTGIRGETEIIILCQSCL
jgi:hypothetical protein